MQTQVDFNGKPFHFLGIGGIGMSALAHIVLKHRLPVSGSDLRSSGITDKLEQLGAQVFLQQEAANLQQVIRASEQLPQVVCSTAIRAENPEYKAALELGCPILHRSDLLAALLHQYQGIAVAGTHGKTTTSSLIGYVLLQAGLDPTIVVGGEVKAWGGNARLGEGDYLVAEADESDGSLAKFAPKIGVITNIELDHPDHYSTLEQVVEIFQTFANHTETLVVSWDCPNIRQQLANHPQLLRYSVDIYSDAEYRVDQIHYGGQGTTAQVWENQTCLGTIQLPILGEHNLKNALAAIAVARHVGVAFAEIADALASFEGAKRRFEIRGETQGIRFIDDYAHHPSELVATLASARLQVQDSSTPWQRVIAVFQPHRYSRTHTFLTEFSESFGAADLVMLTSIYSAGEPDQGLVKGEDLANLLIQKEQAPVLYEPTLDGVKAALPAQLKAGDLVLFLGAGNLNSLIPEVIAALDTAAAPKSVVSILTKGTAANVAQTQVVQTQSVIPVGGSR
jgi:UDP-N-acetylmuramate--alanine ligase